MRSTTAVVTTCALWLLAAGGCDSTPARPAAVDAGAAKAALDAGPPLDPMSAQLVAGKWAGTVGEREPIELTFTKERDGLVAQLVFRRFGRAIVREHLKADPPVSLHLKGTRATPLVGKGPAALHEISATLGPDGITGTCVAKGGDPKGVAFAASTKKTIAEVDPPLDPARGESALVDGKWEGKAGDEPARLVVTRQGTRLVGKFSHGDSLITVEPKAQPDGVVTFASSPHRSGTKVVTATFEVAFARLDLGEITGTLKVVTQLGAMMQGQSYPLTLENRKTKKK
jgi:hypothetical protein